MRTVTSGIFQREASFLAPEWQSARDLYEVSLKFVLSDSRVYAGIVGMRWPEEVDRNIELLSG
jgi:aryl-alcohol dehydrogenase-like predicted oxidoreductase